MNISKLESIVDRSLLFLHLVSAIVIVIAGYFTSHVLIAIIFSAIILGIRQVVAGFPASITYWIRSMLIVQWGVMLCAMLAGSLPWVAALVPVLFIVPVAVFGRFRLIPFAAVYLLLVALSLPVITTVTGSVVSPFQSTQIISVSLAAFLFVTMICYGLAYLLKKQRQEANILLEKEQTRQENAQLELDFAREIAKGNFDTSCEAADSTLGEVLDEMRSSLKEAAERERNEKFIDSNMNDIFTLLRDQTLNYEELCMQILQHAIQAMGANQGAMFLTNTDSEGKIHLDMVACYAYNKKRYATRTVEPGEGLVGQVFLEGESIYVNNIPKGYLTIASGLGYAEPRYMILWPIKHHDKVVGVIEIASFAAFSESHKRFMDKLSESTGSTISSIKMADQVRKMYEEGQMVNEQLMAQEEEMRQNMEELMATQEEMERTQAEVMTKERNLNALINNTKDTIFAIDRTYCITVVNEPLMKKYAKMGINLQVGTNISDLLSGDAWTKWKARYDRALNGEQYAVSEERVDEQGNPMYLETHHNPIRDENGNVVGISVIARNVTVLMSARKEAEQRQSVMNALINNMEDTFFAIDHEYKITVINKTLQDRYQAMGQSLKEGDYIFDKIPENVHKTWKDRYDRALRGESFVIPQERRVGEKVLFVEGHYHPITDKSGKIIGASVTSHDITKLKDLSEQCAMYKQEIDNLRGKPQGSKPTTIASIFNVAGKPKR